MHGMQTAAANVEKMDKMEDELKEAVSKLDLDELEATPDVEEHGVCNLTLQNYVDALRDADCMCLALDVSRPEAAIAGENAVLDRILPVIAMAAACVQCTQSHAAHMSILY